MTASTPRFQQPYFFEDWTIDEEFVTVEREITIEEVTDFARVEGHQSPLHLDEDYAQDSVFGELTVHGLMTASIATGLIGLSGAFDGTGLAMLSSSWDFHGPVRVGDRIHVRWWVSHKRVTSTPGRGVIVRNLRVVNQAGETVCSGEITALWAMRSG